MEIKTNEIKKLYQEYLTDQRPAGREDCPSFQELLGFLSKTRRSRRKIVKHLTSCVYCLEEIDSILKILLSKDLLVAEIASFLKDEAAGRKKTAKRFSDFKMKELAPYALVPLLLIGMAFVFFRSEFTNEENNRGKVIGRILLLTPPNHIVSRASLRLEWKGLDKFKYCFYEIFDDSLRPLWKSPEMNDNVIILPSEVSQKLDKNRLYYWMVTVYFNGGQGVESPLAKFILSD